MGLMLAVFFPSLRFFFFGFSPPGEEFFSGVVVLRVDYLFVNCITAFFFAKSFSPNS